MMVLCMLIFRYSVTLFMAIGQKNNPLTMTHWIFFELKEYRKVRHRDVSVIVAGIWTYA